MPNWCNGFVVVKGKKQNVRDFCKLFIWDEEIDKEINKPFFARSFTNRSWKDFEKKNKNKKEVSFIVDFAWSCWSCLIEGYPTESKKKYEGFKNCVTLEWACKKYNVEVEITSEEGGIGFEETIYADKNGVNYSSKNMPVYKCSCGNKQMISSQSDLNEEECYECERIGDWKPLKKRRK